MNRLPGNCCTSGQAASGLPGGRSLVGWPVWLLLIGCLLAGLTSCGSHSGSDERTQASDAGGFTVLASGDLELVGLLHHRRFEAYRSRDELDQALASLPLDISDAALDAVDFGKNLVVGVFLGEQPSISHSTRVSGADIRTREFVVHVETTEPVGVDDGALSSPWQLVSVAADANTRQLPLRFTETVYYTYSHDTRSHPVDFDMHYGNENELQLTLHATAGEQAIMEFQISPAGRAVKSLNQVRYTDLIPGLNYTLSVLPHPYAGGDVSKVSFNSNAPSDLYPEKWAFDDQTMRLGELIRFLSAVDATDDLIDCGETYSSWFDSSVDPAPNNCMTQAWHQGLAASRIHFDSGEDSYIAEIFILSADRRYRVLTYYSDQYHGGWEATHQISGHICDGTTVQDNVIICE